MDGSFVSVDSFPKLGIQASVYDLGKFGTSFELLTNLMRMRSMKMLLRTLTPKKNLLTLQFLRSAVLVVLCGSLCLVSNSTNFRLYFISRRFGHLGQISEVQEVSCDLLVVTQLLHKQQTNSRNCLRDAAFKKTVSWSKFLLNSFA